MNTFEYFDLFLSHLKQTGEDTNFDAESRQWLYRFGQFILESKSGSRFTPPALGDMVMHGAKIGLPRREVDKFAAFYSSKGWMVGKNRMKSWQCAMTGWKIRWEAQGRPESNDKPSLVDKQISSLANQSSRL